MSHTLYNALVLEHFTRPRNVGALPPAPDVIQGRAGSPAQGAEFRLTAQVQARTIQRACFQAYGCPHCLAAGSLLTTLLIGGRPEALTGWSWRGLAEALQVPTAKRGRLLILEDAVHAMAEDWRKRF